MRLKAICHPPVKDLEYSSFLSILNEAETVGIGSSSVIIRIFRGN